MTIENLDNLTSAAERLVEIYGIAHGDLPAVPSDEQAVIDWRLSKKEHSLEERIKFVRGCMGIILNPPVGRLFIEHAEPRFAAVGVGSSRLEEVCLRDRDGELQLEYVVSVEDRSCLHPELTAPEQSREEFIQYLKADPSNRFPWEVNVEQRKLPASNVPGGEITVEGYTARRQCLPEDIAEGYLFSDFVGRTIRKCHQVRESLVRQAFREAGVKEFDESRELRLIQALEEANRILQSVLSPQTSNT